MALFRVVYTINSLDKFKIERDSLVIHEEVKERVEKIAKRFLYKVKKFRQIRIESVDPTDNPHKESVLTAWVVEEFIDQDNDKKLLAAKARREGKQTKPVKMKTTTYEKAMKIHGDNDVVIYNSILKIMQDVKPCYDLEDDEEFELEGAEEIVRTIQLVDNQLEIVTRNPKDLEEFEYAVADDAVSQLDKLELLRILESKFGTVK